MTLKQEMLELAPCPFCGMAPRYELVPMTTGSRPTIFCENDECFGPHTTAVFLDDAVRQWNTCSAQQAEAGDERVDEIVTRLYRRFKDWSARGFGPDDMTWCEVKADIIAIIAEHPAPVPGAGAREAVSALTKIAAECHRAKWQFDFNDENRLHVGQARDMVKRAFGELHRIGDEALKLRDGLRALAGTVTETERATDSAPDVSTPVPRPRE